jgi:hypothetical protein
MIDDEDVDTAALFPGFGLPMELPAWIRRGCNGAIFSQSTMGFAPAGSLYIRKESATMTQQTYSKEEPSEAGFMQSAAQPSISGKQFWAGRIVSGLATLFMLVNGVMKIVKPAPVLEANVRLGHPIPTLSGIGLVLLACTAIYAIPRTFGIGCNSADGLPGRGGRQQCTHWLGLVRDAASRVVRRPDLGRSVAAGPPAQESCAARRAEITTAHIQRRRNDDNR